MSEKLRALIVDDEVDIRHLISDILSDEGFETELASEGIGALSSIDQLQPHIIILDIWLQGSELDGLGLLELLKGRHPEIPVIMISGHGTIATAVQSLKMGAFDYIEKPFTEDRLLLVVRRAIEHAKLKKENEFLKQQTESDMILIGNSSEAKSLRQQLPRLAQNTARIMLMGPEGSGKHFLSRLIHAHSPRSSSQFIAFNPQSVTPSECMEILFGSSCVNPFTPGLLEQANNGTLYISNITLLPLPTQQRLLKTLQSKTIERPGNLRPIPLETRLITSTKAAITDEIARGLFDENLYYRLSVVPLSLSPLAKRSDDIPLFAKYFLHYFADLYHLPLPDIREDAIAKLQFYSWPGNIRECRNIVERLLLLSANKGLASIDSNVIEEQFGISSSPHQQTNVLSDMMSLSLKEARELFEKHYISAQVARFGGNISKTAMFIGMERSALHRKIKTIGLETELSETSSQLVNEES